jgi:hypothetical protein
MKAAIAMAVAIAIGTFAHSDDRHGSTVFLFIPNQDYVVVAGESLTLDGNDSPIDSQSCKIISLGNSILFAATGNISFELKRTGKINDTVSWTASSTARSLYHKYGADIPALASHWAKNSEASFSLMRGDQLRSLQENGLLAKGIFVTYLKGELILWNVRVSYSSVPTPHAVGTAKLDSSRNSKVLGYARDLIEEFVAGKTKRASDARRICCPYSLGKEPGLDAHFAEAAVRFAITYAKAGEKGRIGLPIDVAILQRDKPVRWSVRKDICYKEDAN